MDPLSIAFLGGFIGVSFMMAFGMNPATLGLGAFVLIIPLLPLFFQQSSEAALIAVNQVVGISPLLIMESLGASLALGVVAAFTGN